MKKRTLVLAVLSLLAALCAISLNGCGLPVTEGMIARDLGENLDKIKHADEGITDQMLGDAAKQFQQLNIDPKEFYKSFLEDFNYKINDIKVTGDTASADVTINCKQVKSFVGHFMIELGMDMKSMTGEESYSEMKNIVSEGMMKAVKETESKETSCTFTYHRRSGGTWSADANKTTEALTKAMGAADFTKGSSNSLL